MAMAPLTQTPRASAATPPRIRTRRISSVAYADELIASELKIARAFFFERRSPISSSLARGRPRSSAFARDQARPAAVGGTNAASFAVSCPGPVQRKRAEWGRSTRTRRSPGFRPCRDRRPPIMGRRAPGTPRGGSPASQPDPEPIDQADRQAGRPHLRLDGRDVVGHTVPAGLAGVGLELEPAGPRVAV